MGDVVRRLIAFTLGASAVAYGSLLVAGTVIEARATERDRTVWARDVVGPNIHRISGMIMVPSTCTELNVKPVQISPIAYKLPFTTWEHPGIECTRQKTPVAFRTIVFAPAVGVQFIATLDDKPLPIVVTPTLENE